MNAPLLPLMVYALSISGLMALAAWGAERLGVLLRAPVRWVWIAALFGSVAIPTVKAFGPGPEADLLISAAVMPTIPGSAGAMPEAVGVADPGFVPWTSLRRGLSLDAIPAGDSTLLLIGWALLSAMALGILLASSFRLSRARRRWPRREVEGTDVRVNPHRGPAVVGVIQPEVLLPAWVLRIERDLLRLVLRHEEGHLAARDTQLLAVGAIPLLLMPWNLPMWWQFRRLRAAVEVDCDRRVLRAGADPTGYARALVEVGSRRLVGTGYAAALFHPGPALERRLKMMIDTVSARRIAGAGLGLALAAFAGLMACESEAPLRPLDEPVQLDTVAAPPLEGVEAFRAAWEAARIAAEEMAGTEWEPEDWTSFQEELEGTLDRYRAAREAFEAGEGPDPGEFRMGELPSEISGTRPGIRDVPATDSSVVVASEAGEGADSIQGKIGGARILRSGGEPGSGVFIELRTPRADTTDTLTVKRAGIEEFADTSGIEIAETTFEALPDPQRPPEPAAVEERESSGPVFTPYDEQPILANRAEMERALMREYPPVLRNAGIGGDVTLHFHISDTGEVLETVLAESSGHASMDEAAERVASVMRFEPAGNLGRAVAVWVQLKISFKDR